MKTIKWVALTCTLALPGVVQAAGFSSAELNAVTCFSCHGAEGQPAGGAIPPLSVYPEAYMAQSLKDIKSGKKNVTIMKRHISAYSDAEIDALAKYISSLNKKQ